MFCLYLIKVVGLRDAPHVAQWLDWEYLRERARVQALLVTFPPYFPFFFLSFAALFGPWIKPRTANHSPLFSSLHPFYLFEFFIIIYLFYLIIMI
jgi:hypothetical protein